MVKQVFSELMEYPNAVYVIVVTEFLTRVSFCGLRTLLSLYLRNVLLFPEALATSTYHTFVMVCYIVPIASAILADGYLGRFRAILYFSLINATGTIVMFLAATPPLHLDPVTWTSVGLWLIEVGAGGMKPCVAAFAADQFRLPQQSGLLTSFSSLFYFTASLGSLIGMIISPILRNSISCFGFEFCYSMGFGVPAGIMVISVVIFISGKPEYRIKSPKDNTIGEFFACVMYALTKKISCRKESEKKTHWLDYAATKYDQYLIKDIKAVLAIALVFLPLPIFWSLLVQQGSRWTFQATRMDAEIMGIQLIPDQIQAIGPAIMLLLIPIFNKLIYPGLKSCNILVLPLQRMTVGGVMAGLAFFCAFVLELNLQETYPTQPVGAEAHIVVANTLPCDIEVRAASQRKGMTLPNGQILTINEQIENTTTVALKKFYISSQEECGERIHDKHTIEFTVPVEEGMVRTVIVGQAFSEAIATFMLEKEDLEKALSGRPKLRLIFMRSSKLEEGSFKVGLYTMKEELLTVYNVGNLTFGVSNYTQYKSGRYIYFVMGLDRTNEFQGFLDLKPGGVYSLVLREYDKEIEFAENIALTPPNHVHILWLIPQYLFISVAEVLFTISGLEFCMTQAPKTMKTVTMALWFFTVAMGNLIIIIVSQIQLFSTQAKEFAFYAILILLDMVLFARISSRYVNISPEASTTGSSVTSISIMPSEILIHP